jgi:hypothetical protein
MSTAEQTPLWRVVANTYSSLSKFAIQQDGACVSYSVWGNSTDESAESVVTLTDTDDTGYARQKLSYCRMTDPIFFEVIEQWQKLVAPVSPHLIANADQWRTVARFAASGEPRQLGTFTLDGTSLIVTDPCYERGTWCQGVVENALPGVWEAAVVYANEGSLWGIRNRSLEAHHASYTPSDNWEKAPFEVGVDSGIAGIFAESLYPRDKKQLEHEDRQSFYGRVSTEALGILASGIMPEGAVSLTAYGDGGYDCFTHKNDAGNVDGVRVVFSTPEENKET